MSLDLNHEKFFLETQKIALKSKCLRSKCGAIIVLNNEIIATGFNEPAQGLETNRKCTVDFPVINRRKPKGDCTCCVHAEQNAIISALKAGTDLEGSTMYFLRIDDHGWQKPSGDPNCINCSRLALHVGIAQWVLLHDDGPKIYESRYYNNRSVEYHLTIK